MPCFGQTTEFVRVAAPVRRHDFETLLGGGCCLFTLLPGQGTCLDPGGRAHSMQLHGCLCFYMVYVVFCRAMLTLTMTHALNAKPRRPLGSNGVVVLTVVHHGRASCGVVHGHDGDALVVCGVLKKYMIFFFLLNSLSNRCQRDPDDSSCKCYRCITRTGSC